MEKKLSFYLEKVFGLSNKAEHGYVDETTNEIILSVVAISNLYNSKMIVIYRKFSKKSAEIIPNVHF